MNIRKRREPGNEAMYIHVLVHLLPALLRLITIFYKEVKSKILLKKCCFHENFQVHCCYAIEFAFPKKKIKGKNYAPCVIDYSST